MKTPLLFALALLVSPAAQGQGAATCADNADGTACSFTSDSHVVNGTCRVGPDKQPSTCLPSPNDAALSACAAKSETESCSYSDDDVTLKGSCAKAGISLACTPSKPVSEAHAQVALDQR